MEEQENEKWERKLKGVFKARTYTVFVSDNVFCQGMVVLLNPVCILLPGMPHVYKSEVRVAVFET